MVSNVVAYYSFNLVGTAAWRYGGACEVVRVRSAAASTSKRGGPSGSSLGSEVTISSFFTIYGGWQQWQGSQRLGLGVDAQFGPKGDFPVAAVIVVSLVTVGCK